MHSMPIRWIVAAALCTLSFSAVAAVGDARAATPEEAAPALSAVQFHDGAAWAPVALHNGAVEGMEGGKAATALLKSQLGGPKIYFVMPDATSETAISIARPRFRVEGAAGMVHRLQLAILEVKEETRRTPVETVKGLTLFKRRVELEAKEMRDGVWELRPKKSLQPGEYALALGTDGPVADFTIAARGY